MLHVLSQLAPPSGPCRDCAAQATPRRRDRTVDPLPTLGTDQNPGCVCSGGLFRPPTATASLGSRAPPQLWGPVPAHTPPRGEQGCPFSRLGPQGKGVLSAPLRVHSFLAMPWTVVFMPL